MSSNFVKMEKVEIKGDDGKDGYYDLDVGSRPSRKTSLKITVAVLSAVLVLAVALIVVFAVLYGVSRSENESSSSTESDVCQSEACFELSVQIRGAMEETVDPCEDFYNFTCGNWDTFNHITQGMAGFNPITVQQFDVFDELADVLETKLVGVNSVLTELRDFYEACIAEQLTDNVNLQPFRDLFQRLGGWSVVNIPGDGSVWDINSTQFIREKALGSQAFYSLIVDINDAYTDRYLRIDQSGLTLDYPFQYCNPNSTELMRQQIIVFLTKLSQMNTTKEIMQVADDIVDFETNLAQIWDYADSINSTVQDLTLLWPDHDWLTVLKGVFSLSGVEIKPSSIVTVVNPNYLMNLTSLIRNTPVTTLENYAKWQPVWKFAQSLSADSEIRESLVEFREVVMGKPSMEQRQECVAEAAGIMPIALGRVYAQYILPSGYKEVGMELVLQVREGLRQRMMEVDWLDEDTRQLAIEKLEAIEARVAYPARTFDDDYLETLYGMFQFNDNTYFENAINYPNISTRQYYSLLYQPVDRTLWAFSPTTVNAYYFAQFNQITILEAIMKVPIFNKDWPLSMLYGGLGMIVGHEFTHGFDNKGRQYDKDGRKRMWWTEAAVQNFKDRTQCFVDQYSNFELFGTSVVGNLTLGENIADNGGLKASYDAYKKLSQGSQRLPGLSKYTNDQVFFIGFGQLWCSYTTEQSFSVAAKSDKHSPNIFRVLGTLMNNADFAEAFTCPVGSRMNPQDKCLLW